MSKIEWTEKTWNPLAGCTRVSAGCENCYAEIMAHRLMHMGQEKYAGTVKKTAGGKIQWTGKINLDEKALAIPYLTKKPTFFFVNSMSDLFHENVPFAFIEKVYRVMAENAQHTFQVLTKRSKRMFEFFEWLAGCVKNAGIDSVPTQSSNIMDYLIALPNVWWGVSVENQESANERIPYLLQIPATVRFLSCEPLLGYIDLTSIAQKDGTGKIICYYQVLHPIIDAGDGSRKSIDWIIAGGESGHNARPMHPDWVIGLKNQCVIYDVPFFFKQWGEWAPHMLSKAKALKSVMHNGFGQDMCKVGKKASGSKLQGIEYKQFPKGYYKADLLL